MYRQPDGPLHVGHPRGGLLGDALAVHCLILRALMSRANITTMAGKVEYCRACLFCGILRHTAPRGCFPEAHTPALSGRRGCVALQNRLGDAYIWIGDPSWLEDVRNFARREMKLIREDLALFFPGGVEIGCVLFGKCSMARRIDSRD